MAMLDSSIYAAKNEINNIQTEFKSLTNNIVSFNEYLLKQKDYVNFATDTEIGQKSRSEFENIFSLINTEIIPRINNLTSRTNLMLNKQLENNSQQEVNTVNDNIN